MRLIDKIWLEIGSARKVRKENPNPIKDWPQNVVSKAMGCDRGMTISRWYIEKFIRDNSMYIKGDVVEIGDNSYTMQYGKNINNSYIFTADINKTEIRNSKVIYGDLQNGKGCQSNIADCFILTQTLPFIFDVNNAAKYIVDMLKPAGVALVTVSGISMISEYADSRWGHYWGFTKQSLQLLFRPYVDEKNIMIMSYGNAKTAAAFLYGLCQQDLCREDFLYNDELVPVVLCAKIVK